MRPEAEIRSEIHYLCDLLEKLETGRSDEVKAEITAKIDALMLSLPEAEDALKDNE